MSTFPRAKDYSDDTHVIPNHDRPRRIRSQALDPRLYKHRREQRYQENKKILMLELDENRDLGSIESNREQDQRSALALASFKYRNSIAKIQVEEQCRIQTQINQMKHHLNEYKRLQREIDSLKNQLSSLRMPSSANSTTTSPPKTPHSRCLVNPEDSFTDGSDGQTPDTNCENEDSESDLFWMSNW